MIKKIKEKLNDKNFVAKMAKKAKKRRFLLLKRLTLQESDDLFDGRDALLVGDSIVK